jgi:hypothetical protein
MVDLKPLTNTDAVSTQEFRQLFEARLGNLFDAAMRALTTFGPMHSFSVANVVHLGLQKGNIDKVVSALEKWAEVVIQAPNHSVAYADTREFFDIMYGECFMSDGDTLDGFGPFKVVETTPDGTRWIGMGSETSSGLWVP